ncbi:MAG: CBS domain-containing protein [Deltaproteobacteria bacterium]|nr:CBS domain-containing protein [Deltaproteobacteria bacterium]
MEEKKVHDLMLLLDEYATVPSNSTIKEALEVLSKAQRDLHSDRYFHRAVLVLDEAGQVVGKLSHWAILRSLEPELIKNDDEASLARAGLTEDFIKSIKETFSHFAGGFEQICRAAGQIEVKDAMVSIGESIDENAPLSEAVHQMVQHVMSIPVTRKGEVVGILRQSDIFEAVAELIRSSDA